MTGERARSPVMPDRSLPSSVRLKRRSVLRVLFRRGDPENFRAGIGPALLVARRVPCSQLGSASRVQAGVAARRGLRGVRRNRVRRQLLESFRECLLPSIRERVVPRLPSDQAVAVLLIDRSRGDQPFDVAGLRAGLDDVGSDLCGWLLRETEKRYPLERGP